ncbi:winged helix domain-containing protein [Rhizobium leguminosarum]|uniref:winged helix domain-containing protein n=1 Tax=Rhizobium leguminosarum TaxID=384 RepID=UPI003D06F006
MSKKRLTISVRILPDGKPIKVVGREAWALQNLAKAGAAGCTPIDHPGPRWSSYVLDLRGMGFVVETIHEPHGGPFAGTHARYVLRSEIEILTEAEAA